MIGMMGRLCMVTMLVLLPVALLGADEATSQQLVAEHAAKGVRPPPATCSCVCGAASYSDS